MTNEEIIAWHRRTFPEVTARVLAEKLLEEANEAYEFASMGHPLNEHLAEELADLYIVLVCAAGRLGIDLAAEVSKKMDVNKQRVWTKQDDGCYTRDRGDDS